MRICKTLLVLMVVALAISACDSPQPPAPRSPTTLVPAKMEPEAKIELARSDRGFGYILLDLDGNPDDHVVEILNALQNFETKNPGLYITDWHVEKQQQGYITHPYTFGIWISYSKIPE